MESDQTTTTHVIELTGVKYSLDGSISQSTLRFLGSDDMLVGVTGGSSETSFSTGRGTLTWAGVDGMTLYCADEDESDLNKTITYQGVYMLPMQDGTERLFFSLTSGDLDIYLFSLMSTPLFENGYSEQEAIELFSFAATNLIPNNNIFAFFDGTQSADAVITSHFGTLKDIEQGDLSTEPDGSVDPTTTDGSGTTGTGTGTDSGTDGETGTGTGTNTAEGKEIFGTDQDDTLVGTDGDDTIMGFDGNDQIYAGDGNDLIFGHQGNDIIFGENGDDTVWASDGDDYVEGGDGNDRLGAGHGTDKVDGGAGNDVIVKISGDGIISGGTDNDILIGGYQNDRIFGGTGDDWIRGDISSVVGGMDTIEGGAGNDILSGGLGQDTFIFRPDQGTDKIAFFEMTQASMNGVLDMETDLARDWDHLDQVHLIGFTNIDRSNIMSFVEQGENGAVLSIQGTTIEFFGVAATELSAEDFYFA